MFVCTLHKQTIKKAAALCAFAVMAVGAIIGVRAVISQGSETEAAEAAAAVRAKTQISDAQSLTTYLSGCGLETDGATASVTTVKIPRKWDDSFVAFNAVIEQSGLGLTKYKNKKVDRWMVNVPSKNTDSDKTYAIVLVYENEPVGAYLLQKPSGEVLPLIASSETLAEITPESALITQGEAEAGSVEVGAEASSIPVSAEVEFGEGAQPAAAEVLDPSVFPTE